MTLVVAHVRACRWAGGNTLLQVLVTWVTITLHSHSPIPMEQHARGSIGKGGIKRAPVRGLGL